MHPTAMNNAKHFFDCYGSHIKMQGADIKVIEIGSQDVNGSLRSTCPDNFDYVGVDFVSGRGVDVVLDDPYHLPFDAESADVVVSSSCFEHSEMFWILFLEILRILKPNGLFYLNVPSNGEFHRWPVDCWRFYPDSGRALVTWAQRNGINATLLESYTSTQVGDQWNDFVAVFLKENSLAESFPNRILDTKNDISNGWVHNGSDFKKYSAMPEDKKKLQAISDIVANRIKVV
jgi:SAM-dependent methyltransferase